MRRLGFHHTRRRKVRLTTNQVRGFWASWAGWALDGMDSFIYALVLVPALRELLPKSGIAATAGNVGYYGGLLFALFLVGWGLALIWGPVADRFGRVRTLMLHDSVLLGLHFSRRVRAQRLAGCDLPPARRRRHRRRMGHGRHVRRRGMARIAPQDGRGLMHTGYYFGFFLAAIANHFIGETHGWRPMFAIGGAPALLVGFILYGVNESDALEIASAPRIEAVRTSCSSLNFAAARC